jgi:hypothetical protein
VTIRNQNVKINRGDSVTIFVAVTNADGTSFDPTANAVFKWRLTNNAYDLDEEALIRKDLGSGISLVTSPIKGVNISLSDLDTTLPPGFYYHELKVWDNVDTTTVMTGLVILKRVMKMVKEDLAFPPSQDLVLTTS